MPRVLRANLPHGTEDGFFLRITLDWSKRWTKIVVYWNGVKQWDVRLYRGIVITDDEKLMEHCREVAEMARWIKAWATLHYNLDWRTEQMVDLSPELVFKALKDSYENN